MKAYTTPQFIMMALLALQIVGGFYLHGSVRSDPKWNGALEILEALFFMALLGWGGFWDRRA